MECVKAKESILAVWKLIQEILSLCNTNKPWLAEQEEKLKAIEKRYKTTPLSLLQPLRSETEVSDLLEQFLQLFVGHVLIL